MNLISKEFIELFLIVILFLLSRFKWKRVALLTFNIVFYIFAGVEASILFFAFSLFTYFAGILIEKYNKKHLFVIFLIISLLPLACYKYMDFIISDILKIASFNGIIKLTAPLGISFFTFQGVGYLADVYKKKINAERNFLNYFVFLSLFTCISSGPINRSESLLTQIREYDKTAFDYERCVSGARYVLVGLFMKIFIVSCLVKTASPSYNSGLALLFSSICYTITIYCDFCGYSYMAFGLSKIMGLSVIQNFDKPYFSCSIGEFWRRWHISLSSWLRDYVYIPLGGSRCSKIRASLNTIVTFFVSGIWHGANMTFVLWGLLNGFIIAIERIVGYSKKSASKLINAFKYVITLITINTLWIFFKASSITEAFLTIKTILVKTFGEIISMRSFNSILAFTAQLGVSNIDFIKVTIAIIAFLLYMLIEKKYDEPIEFFESKNAVIRWMKYLFVVFVVLIFGSTGDGGNFIYADF